MQVAITAYGQVFDLATAAGLVLMTITCEDPSTRTPIDITGMAAVLTVASLDLSENASRPPLVTVNANLTDPTHGVCTVSWTPALNPGVYGYDFWLTDSSLNRLQLVAFSRLRMS